MKGLTLLHHTKSCDSCDYDGVQRVAIRLSVTIGIGLSVTIGIGFSIKGGRY